MKPHNTSFRLIGGKDGDHFHRKALGEFASKEEAVRCAENLKKEFHIDWWIISETSPGAFKVVSEDAGRFAPPRHQVAPDLLSGSSQSLSPSSGWS